MKKKKEKNIKYETDTWIFFTTFISCLGCYWFYNLDIVYFCVLNNNLIFLKINIFYFFRLFWYANIKNKF